MNALGPSPVPRCLRLLRVYLLGDLYLAAFPSFPLACSTPSQGLTTTGSTFSAARFPPELSARNDGRARASQGFSPLIQTHENLAVTLYFWLMTDQNSQSLPRFHYGLPIFMTARLGQIWPLPISVPPSRAAAHPRKPPAISAALARWTM
jgi:hypothetical protein